MAFGTRVAKKDQVPFWQQTGTPFWQRKIYGRQGQAALQMGAAFSLLVTFIGIPVIALYAADSNKRAVDTSTNSRECLMRETDKRCRVKLEQMKLDMRGQFPGQYKEIKSPAHENF